MTQILKDILNLSVSERILMVEAIWDSIPENETEFGLSDETRQILDDRLANHMINHTEGSSWDEVRSRIKNQF